MTKVSQDMHEDVRISVDKVGLILQLVAFPSSGGKSRKEVAASQDFDGCGKAPFSDLKDERHNSLL